MLQKVYRVRKTHGQKYDCKAADPQQSGKMQGGRRMLRMSVAAEEYVMIGDDIRLVFLGGTGNHMRIMIDAPRELNIVRSKALEKRIQDPELREKMPRYYREEEHPEKYKKRNISIVRNAQTTSAQR